MGQDRLLSFRSEALYHVSLTGHWEQSPLWRRVNARNVSFAIFFTMAIWFSSNFWRAAVAQWREHSPPTNVVRVQFPDLTPYVGWVCWFSTLLWGVFPRVLLFSPTSFPGLFSAEERMGGKRQGLFLPILSSAEKSPGNEVAVFPSPQKPTFDLIWVNFNLQCPQLVPQCYKTWYLNKVPFLSFLWCQIFNGNIGT